MAFFYQAGDKTGELELEPGRKSDNGLPDSLAGVVSQQGLIALGVQYVF